MNNTEEKNYIEYKKNNIIKEKLQKDLGFQDIIKTFYLENIKEKFGYLEFLINFINYTDKNDNPYQRYNAFVFYGSELVYFEDNRSFTKNEEEQKEFLNKFILKYKWILNDINNQLNNKNE